MSHEFEVNPEILDPPPYDLPRPTDLDFPNALREVIMGKSITKREWNNDDIYGALINGFLLIHKPGEGFNAWIISDGDLLGEDWITLYSQ